MKIDMCSGAIVCHPLGSSSRCRFVGKSSSSTGCTDRSSFSMPSIIVSSFEWKVCILFSSLWRRSPKLSTQPLRHAERACEHQCEGSPYHRISIQMFLPHLSTYWASSILIPATNQEMLPDLRPLLFSFSVSFSLISACDGTA